jgi:hypothetical protein
MLGFMASTEGRCRRGAAQVAEAGSGERLAWVEQRQRVLDGSQSSSLE